MIDGNPAAYLLGFPLTRAFGDLSFPQYGPHTGIDIAMPLGTPIPTLFSGQVTVDDDDPRLDMGDPRTWSGIQVTVRHADGSLSIFAHGSRNVVTLDQFVSRGQVVMYCGATGAATGPHLHYERRDAQGRAFDPLPEMRREAEVMTAEEFEALFLEMTRKHVTPTIDAMKDAYDPLVTHVHPPEATVEPTAVDTVARAGLIEVNQRLNRLKDI